MTVEFAATIPVLRIFSVEKAREFYIGFLGFEVDWEHRFEDNTPIYMQISRNGLTLHLSEHYGDGTPGSVTFVRTRGLDAFHREITAKGNKYLRPGIEDREWNAREMTIHDPFGNRIRFTEYKS